MDLGIGAAARALNTTVRTLHYYETNNLIHPSGTSNGGHRRYDQQALADARRVLALRALGLSLAEIHTAIHGPATQVLRTQQTRLKERIKDLEALQEKLTKAIAKEAINPDTILELTQEVAMSIVINKVYTRTGDDGTTGPNRIPKTDPRIEAQGDLDELITAIGLAITAPQPQHTQILRRLQNELFDLGADVANGGDRIGEDHVLALEDQCDEHNATLTELRSFVLPGATPQEAALHHARAICRRAERHMWTVPGHTAAARYLNRLSDLLFILARIHPGEEHTWTPGV